MGYIFFGEFTIVGKGDSSPYLGDALSYSGNTLNDTIAMRVSRGWCVFLGGGCVSLGNHIRGDAFSCYNGKMQRKPFQALREIPSTRRLQLVHSDVCGPMPTESICWKRYLVTFFDNYSRCCTVYFFKRGAEVPDKFKLFERHVANDSCLNIASLRSFNGGEYLSQKFESYLEWKGIHHELAVPYGSHRSTGQILGGTHGMCSLNQELHSNICYQG